MSFDERAFRNALGQFATGVCVVCAPGANGEGVGMTINSFASVSLAPPLVLWSLQNDSHSYDIYARATHYSINVLCEGQQDYADYYAQQGNHHLLAAHVQDAGNNYWAMRDTLARFHCEQEATVEAGDHLIIIGKVLAFEHSDNARPLLFQGGNYQQMC